ncbi:hypothetical protein B0H13DRAFT_1907628 [Mycena leptocephala]|nr:hypothetical protein B0H13DRAFT_1907628 [Mycena leptocephala]
MAYNSRIGTMPSYSKFVAILRAFHQKKLCERANLSYRLVSFLDQEDADTTGYLAWLEVLVRYTKPLKSRSAEVKARYSRTAKLVIPAERSVVHVLAPSGKKERSYDTLGTYIGQEYKSTSLGHSAGKIGRSASSNMKKVEFYPGSQLLYLVLDARMLDCSSCVGFFATARTDNIFEYFESLSKQDKLPDLEELVEMAKNCTAHTQLRGLAITRFMIPVPLLPGPKRYREGLDGSLLSRGLEFGYYDKKEEEIWR